MGELAWQTGGDDEEQEDGRDERRSVQERRRELLETAVLLRAFRRGRVGVEALRDWLDAWESDPADEGDEAALHQTVAALDVALQGFDTEELPYQDLVEAATRAEYALRRAARADDEDDEEDDEFDAIDDGDSADDDEVGDRVDEPGRDGGDGDDPEGTSLPDGFRIIDASSLDTGDGRGERS